MQEGCLMDEREKNLAQCSREYLAKKLVALEERYLAKCEEAGRLKEELRRGKR